MSGRQAVVLAGGLATRLGERAQGTPKYLLTVAGRPFAHWQLERLAAAGFDEVVLCVGHLGEAIESALGPEQHGMRLSYSSDGDELLGTGGALRRALELLRPTFVVTYGDSYLRFDYAALLADLEGHPDALGSMAVYANDGRYDRSNVAVRGEQVSEYDKRGGERFRYIDYGATALRREALAELPVRASELATLQTELARRGRLRAFEVSERFYEIGSPAGLAELDRLLGSQDTASGAS